jgi:hypothetical protein
MAGASGAFWFATDLAGARNCFALEVKKTRPNASAGFCFARRLNLNSQRAAPSARSTASLGQQSTLSPADFW